MKFNRTYVLFLQLTFQESCGSSRLPPKKKLLEAFMLELSFVWVSLLEMSIGLANGVITLRPVLQ